MCKFVWLQPDQLQRGRQLWDTVYDSRVSNNSILLCGTKLSTARTWLLICLTVICLETKVF